MKFQRLVLSLSLVASFVSTAAIAGKDEYISCVQKQLTALGHAPGPVNGRITQQTKNAFLQLQASHTNKPALAALPKLKKMTAVSYCREIGAAFPKARALMPSQTPFAVRSDGGAGGQQVKLLRTSFTLTERFFEQRYGIVPASRVDIAGSYDRAKLADYTVELMKLRGASLGGVKKVIEDICGELQNRYGGVAYQNQLLLCWPHSKSYGAAWFNKVKPWVAGIMAHEYMHHIQRELGNVKADGGYGSRNRRILGPLWMVEGTAEVVQQDFLTRQMRIKMPSLSKLQKKSMVIQKPLSNMKNSGSMSSYKEYQVAHFAVHLLSERYGKAKMFEYWRAIGQGNNWEKAFQKTYGMSLRQYEAMYETLRRDAGAAGRFAKGG
jgi:hypothetical protein